MLTCIPESFFNWNFSVPDTSEGEARLTFNFFTEQGTITLGGEEYAVVKHGPFSGHWTLERGGEVFADVQKSNPIFRSFELDANDSRLSFKALSPFTRKFGIFSRDQQIGIIEPGHIFTRRSTIDCSPEVPELIQLTIFWLAALTWRRQARDSSSTAAAGH